MPILPFRSPPIYVPNTKTAGEDGGGFSSPRCPIITTTTICGLITVTDCECVNNGPINPVTPFYWRLIEGSLYTYLTGTTSYDPNTKIVTLDNLPATWTPPSYGYTGYMQLRLHCGPSLNSPYKVLDSWTTLNGSPTRNLISTYSNPCDASSGSPPPSSMIIYNSPGACNQATAAYSDYDISWECTTTTESNCSKVTDTTYIEASALGAILALFRKTPDIIADEETELLLVKGTMSRRTGFNQFKRYIPIDDIAIRTINNVPQVIIPNDDRLFLNPDGTPLSPAQIDIYKNQIRKMAGSLTKDIIELRSKRGGVLTKDMIDIIKSVSPNFAPLPSASLARRAALERVRSSARAISKKTTIGGVLALIALVPSEGEAADPIGVLIDSIPGLGTSSLGNSDIQYNCPDVGGNNTAVTAGGIGLPDGSVISPNGNKLPFSDGSPSRNNFFRNNNSSINIKSLDPSTGIPSSIFNNNLLQQNYGFPTTSFPIVKTPK